MLVTGVLTFGIIYFIGPWLERRFRMESVGGSFQQQKNRLNRPLIGKHAMNTPSQQPARSSKSIAGGKQMRGLLAILLMGLTGGPAAAQASRMVSSPQLPAAIGPYSPAVRSAGLLFCSGQIGLDPATNRLVEGGLEAETHRTLQNLQLLLQTAHLNLRNVVSVTVYLKDLREYAAFNRVYEHYFPHDFPARTTVAVSNLPGSAAVEITAVATP